MVNFRITVSLTPEEQAALVAKARQERRNPRDQAAIEIRQALERAGYLRPVTHRNEVQYAV